jgi:hypothetical protein
VSSTIVHAAAIEVAVPAEAAFAYLADGMKQSEWPLGSWNREQLDETLFRGRSLFTGQPTYVRITPSQHSLLVDYEVGPSPETMRRINAAHVTPGPDIDRPAGTCVVTLIKWRLPNQDDDQWRQACATFDTEVFMIKGRLELGF